MKNLKKKKQVKQPSAARFATTFTAWIRTSASSASSKDKIFCNPTVKIFILSGRINPKLMQQFITKYKSSSQNKHIF